MIISTNYAVLTSLSANKVQKLLLFTCIILPKMATDSIYCACAHMLKLLNALHVACMTATEKTRTSQVLHSLI